MHFDLAHFPDFQEGFLSSNVKHDTLEMLLDIRKQLNCRYITHIGYPDQASGERGPTQDISVLTTFPMKWVLRYSAKSYYKVDPLIQGITWFQRQANLPGTVRNLSADAGLSLEAKQFLRDCKVRGLGNLFLTVSVANAYGFRGVTQFSFDVDSADEPGLIDGIRKRMTAVSTRLHNTLHGNRNPALAATAAKLLTKREIDCLYWAANGKTDGEIGEILSIARWTVVTYLQNAKNKLGCSNRTSTVATALALGVIQMPVIASRF